MHVWKFVYRCVCKCAMLSVEQVWKIYLTCKLEIVQRKCTVKDCNYKFAMQVCKSVCRCETWVSMQVQDVSMKSRCASWSTSLSCKGVNMQSNCAILNVDLHFHLYTKCFIIVGKIQTSPPHLYLTLIMFSMTKLHLGEGVLNPTCCAHNTGDLDVETFETFRLSNWECQTLL